MGSAGLQFDSNDAPEAARLNQKTSFVGTGSEISAIGTTYAGMRAFCTSTGSGFTVDNYYIRNAADSAWINEKEVLDTVTESAEGSTAPITDTADHTVTAGYRYYDYFTMPSTDLLYEIVGIEWKNGATVSGNVMCGVDIIDADPPTNDHTVLVALGVRAAQSGTSAVQRNSDIMSNMVRGGTVLGAWASFSSGTATIRKLTGAGSQNQYKATTYSETPNAGEGTAFSTSTERYYLKVYYRSYY